jgi:hypothetical protein
MTLILYVPVLVANSVFVFSKRKESELSPVFCFVRVFSKDVAQRRENDVQIIKVK